MEDYGEWVSEYGLTFPSTHYRSFQRRVFPVNHLHLYWQLTRTTKRQNTQITQHKKWPCTTDTVKKPRLRDWTDRAWFSRLLRHTLWACWGNRAGLFFQPKSPGERREGSVARSTGHCNEFQSINQSEFFRVALVIQVTTRSTEVSSAIGNDFLNKFNK